jgi:FecR protein
MKTTASVLSLCLATALSATPSAVAQLAPGQNLLSSGDPLALAATPAASTSPEDDAYADGVRAINSSRWSDALAIFTRVASLGGAHADAAQYWMAYAENKQGQAGAAIATCGSLRHNHPGSTWIEECGALEIEIGATKGKPVPPKDLQNDELKLLALATLMQHDEKRALKQIDEILNSDSSEKLKQGALFIAGEHHSDTIYPQIARLSFVDGDVRIERGLDENHRKDVTWEEAATGVALAEGYSLVTGDGRAEIELEDASTLYLGPNSVLTINDLSTLAGIPHTEVALLSGTISLHVRPYVAGETFLLRTPTDNVLTKYPGISNLRISSYVDGVAIAALHGGVLQVGLGGTSEMPLLEGDTMYFKGGRRILDAGPTHAPDFSSWDSWVAARYAARVAATTDVLKASGLSTPIPGMAEMEGKGHFFDCEPYGKCWEPTPSSEHSDAAEPAQAAPVTVQAAVASHAVSEPAAQSSSTGRNIRFIGPPAASGPPPGYSDMDTFFPCIPGNVRAMLYGGVLPAAAQYQMQPWAWAVCNSGSWIYQNDRYTWVAGRRHHHPCVHWIKSGNTIAFVPIHPHDVKDHLPVNRKAAVFAIDTKNGRSLQRVSFGNTEPVSLLKEPPRQFRNGLPSPLPRAAEPRMEGHQIHDVFTAKGTPIHSTGIPITFDHHSQNFMMPNHAMAGSRPGSGFAPITNRGGDLQSHGGVYGGGGSYHGSNSGGYSGGYHAGASGGSFHGGGGGSSSSGSGATSSPASSAASAPSASSASASPHR